MHHAAQAYGAVAKKIASPRDLEADLLLKAASKLQAIRDGWDAGQTDLHAALLYNRKLWSIFINSVMSAESPLPDDIRQNVANLGVFVLKHTMSVMSNPSPDRLAALISINRELAAGLRGRV